MNVEVISPVLRTTIAKSDVSTSSKLRYYVKRELNIQSSNHGKSRQTLHDMFTRACEQELDYQELATDISLGCFCRTGVLNSCVILETDAECDTARVLLQNMTFTPEDAVNVAQYIKRLPVKTCGTKAKASLKKMIEAKFVRSESKDNIKRQVFVQPLENVRNMITPLMKQFNEQSFQSTVTELMELFTDTAEFCVTHGNFTADNIVCRTQCVSKVTAFGAELSHYGNGVYDWSVFVADLLIWHYIHELQSETTYQQVADGDTTSHDATSSSSSHRSYCYTIQQCVYEFLSTILEDLDLECDEIDDERVLQMMAAFTGLSILFRTVGDDWNERLPISSSDVRNDILGCAYRLISRYKNITSINSLLMIGLMLA